MSDPDPATQAAEAFLSDRRRIDALRDLAARSVEQVRYAAAAGAAVGRKFGLGTSTSADPAERLRRWGSFRSTMARATCLRERWKALSLTIHPTTESEDFIHALLDAVSVRSRRLHRRRPLVQFAGDTFPTGHHAAYWSLANLWELFPTPTGDAGMDGAWEAAVARAFGDLDARVGRNVSRVRSWIQVERDHLLLLVESEAAAGAASRRPRHPRRRSPSPAVLNETDQKALDFIKNNPGTKGAAVARDVDVTHQHFTSRILPKLRTHGVVNDDGYRWRPPGQAL